MMDMENKVKNLIKEIRKFQEKDPTQYENLRESFNKRKDLEAKQRNCKDTLFDKEQEKQPMLAIQKKLEQEKIGIEEALKKLTPDQVDLKKRLEKDKATNEEKRNECEKTLTDKNKEIDQLKSEKQSIENLLTTEETKIEQARSKMEETFLKGIPAPKVKEWETAVSEYQTINGIQVPFFSKCLR